MIPKRHRLRSPICKPINNPDYDNCLPYITYLISMFGKNGGQTDFSSMERHIIHLHQLSIESFNGI